MSLLHNEDFTIWQLRSSYLSTIKDGIGDRLINVNNSVLNLPGFRAAGWSSATANSNNSTSAKRAHQYSPPIPTTAAVSSEYYRLAAREANDMRDELNGLGFDEGEEDEGGMVTGKSNLDITGRRQIGRGGKKKGRRHQETQQAEAAEDSSDLSDDSDEEGDPVHRAVDQIKFSKMALRRDRADSSPIRSTDNRKPEVMITSPSHNNIASHYRTGSLGTEVSKERPRRDTTTSSDLSTDNEAASGSYKQAQVQFSTDQMAERHRRRRERTGSRVDSVALADLNEQAEDSGAESVGSALSSDFDATAGSGSLLLAGSAGSLDASSPMVLMHKLPSGTGPQTSPQKSKTPAPAPELHDLPPPRPISMVQPVSLLTRQLKTRNRAPSNPVEKFMVLSGRGQDDSLYLKIYVPFSEDPEHPLDLPVMRESKLAEQPSPVIVAEAIGLALWKYSEDARAPSINREKLTVNRWMLRMVEDGEVEYDFPALGRTLPMTDFTSNNNQASKARGRSRGIPYDEFALVEASSAEFEENERLYPQFSQSLGSEESEQSAHLMVPQPSQNKATPSRQNPLLGQPFSSALNDSTLTPADRPAVPVSHATPRLGVSKTLKVRFINLEASAHITTINTTSDTYIAEVLDSVCKRWGLDKSNYLLKVMGSSTVAPLDRTIEALGSNTELDLVRRRFGVGAISLGGSPGSSSPNAPLMVDNNSPAVKKGKKGGHRMLPSLTQKDLIGGYYRRYHVFRKQSMSFTASNHRILTFDNDYMHIVPAEAGKAGDTKTRSISFNDVVGCKVSRRHPKSFRLIVLRGNDATEQKRYDFEARNALEAVEIVDEIKKNMAHYRI